MYEKLVESDLVEADFSRIFELATLTETTSNNTSNGEAKPANYNWGKDLKNRLEANKQLNSDVRKSQYELETEFFTEFFNWLFKDEELTRRAMRVGGSLQNDLKVFGFNKRKNPVLAFLCTRHVQTNILMPGLLNASTYQAIHKAIVNNLIADSEFFKANDYNIIYCTDLYKKSVSEIDKYINAQARILKPSAEVYTVDDLAKNKRAFFNIKTIKELNISKRVAKVQKIPADKLPSAKSVSTTLNSTAFVSKFSSGAASTDNNDDDDNTEEAAVTSKQTASINTIVRELQKSPAAAFATIQYLGITNKLPEAQHALDQAIFSQLTSKEIAVATTKVSSLLAKLKLSEKDARALLTTIMSYMQ
jgi:hypothetical protein